MPKPGVVGWYHRGASPGAVGASVLVGHVDSLRGPAVFYRLSGVRVGEVGQVTRADGSTWEFTISKISVVAREEFPSRAVFGPTARAASIRLITCTGAFEPDTGYADSLIVWGHAVDFHPRTARLVPKTRAGVGPASQTS
jgi:sortase (surface protein transpeptidase)